MRIISEFDRNIFLENSVRILIVVIFTNLLYLSMASYRVQAYYLNSS